MAYQKRKKIEIDESQLVKRMPQAPELEEAVLGAIILESECLAGVKEIITSPEVFYKFENQQVYQAILDLVRTGYKVDLLTVTDQLRKNGKLEEIGGVYYPTSLTMSVVTSAHTLVHAIRLVEHYKLREIIRLAAEEMEAAYEPEADAREIGEANIQAKRVLLDQGFTDGMVHVSEPAGEALATIETARRNPGMLTGVDTGFRGVNRLTNGWQKQTVNILAARPSQGKTALALNFALHADKPVLFFSLEMSKYELVLRLLANIADLDLEQIQRGMIGDDGMNRLYLAQQKLNSLKIYIDDKAGLTTQNFLSRCRRWKQRMNIELVIVDYLQLMQPQESKKARNRETEVSEISRSLKLAAKELDVAVIALSQMNRGIEQGAKRRPELRDLRESGAIEQDADIVMFIYWYDDPNTGQQAQKLYFAKNRNGRIDEIELRFIGASQKWREPSEDFTEQFNAYAAAHSNPNAGISRPVPSLHVPSPNGAFNGTKHFDDTEF